MHNNVGKNSPALAHALNSQLKHKNAHNTNVKTLEGMFLRALYRLQLEALQSSLKVSDHPETTSNPKYGLNAGQLYVCPLCGVGAYIVQSNSVITFCVVLSQCCYN